MPLKAVKMVKIGPQKGHTRCACTRVPVPVRGAKVDGFHRAATVVPVVRFTVPVIEAAALKWAPKSITASDSKQHSAPNQHGQQGVGWS